MGRVAGAALAYHLRTLAPHAPDRLVVMQRRSGDRQVYGHPVPTVRL